MTAAGTDGTMDSCISNPIRNGTRRSGATRCLRGGARTYPLIDGGIYAVNPSMCAYADVVNAGRQDELALMLALGTGAQTRAYTFDEARWWGQLGWARPALDMVFDGVADTSEFEAGALMGDRYVRLQVELAADLAQLGARLTLLDGPRLDISSTELRRRVAEGKPIRYQTPDAVASYIAERRLYRLLH